MRLQPPPPSRRCSEFMANRLLPSGPRTRALKAPPLPTGGLRQPMQRQRVRSLPGHNTPPCRAWLRRRVTIPKDRELRVTPATPRLQLRRLLAPHPRSPARDREARIRLGKSQCKVVDQPGRSAPVFGRSNLRRAEAVPFLGCHSKLVRCCARGRAHSHASYRQFSTFHRGGFVSISRS